MTKRRKQLKSLQPIFFHEVVTKVGFGSVAEYCRAAPSAQDADRRKLIDDHLVAARRAEVDADALVDGLAAELSGPDLHALIAKLLERFVAERSWVHIDIAGPAFLEKPKSWAEAGASGALVRTLVEVARQQT